MLTGFIRNVRLYPQNEALIINDIPYSYSELYNIARGISNSILENTTDTEKLIGIYTEFSVNTYASIIGILLSGKGFVPLNNKFPKEKLKIIASESGIRTILCSQKSLQKVNELEISDVKILLNDNPRESSMEVTSMVDELQPGYILYTSGSTGKSKGIAINHKNFRSFISSMTDSGNYDFTSSDRFLQIFELSFDVSIACTFLAWETGAALIPVDTESLVFISALELIQKHKVTIVSMAPSAVSYMKQLRLLDEFEFPFIRYTFLTGEALPFSLAEAWKKTAPNSIIENAYGPTEVTVWSFMYRCTGNTINEIINGLVPIGRPLSGVDYKIINDTNPSDNTTGQLILYGNQVANGYWNNEERTKQSFIVENEVITGYSTGDWVHENEQGDVVYINRIDYQVQINGFRVEPGEIEFRIKEFTKNENCVVLPIEKLGSTILVAIIENLEDSGVLIKKYLEQVLPSYMIPKYFYDVKNMPLNSSGKIDRKELREIYS